MNPDTFLLAAEILSPDGVTFEDERFESDVYACHAIRKAQDNYSGKLDKPDTDEHEFFVDMFLDGRENTCSPDGMTLKFGYTWCQECRGHRIMALLLCWAITSRP
jgi:hypothetical protein